MTYNPIKRFQFYQFKDFDYPDPNYRQATEDEIEEAKKIEEELMEELMLIFNHPEEWKQKYGTKKTDKAVDKSNIRASKSGYNHIRDFLQRGKEVYRYYYIGILNYRNVFIKNKKVGITELSIIVSYIFDRNDFGKFLKLATVGALGFAVKQDEYIPLLENIEKYTNRNDKYHFPEDAVKIFRIVYKNKIAWLAINRINKKIKHDPNNHPNGPIWEDIPPRFKLEKYIAETSFEPTPMDPEFKHTYEIALEAPTDPFNDFNSFGLENCANITGMDYENAFTFLNTQYKLT